MAGPILMRNLFQIPNVRGYIQNQIPSWLVSLNGINDVGLKVEKFSETFPITIYSKDGYQPDGEGRLTIRTNFRLNTFIICNEKTLVAFIRTILMYVYATMPEADFIFGIGSINNSEKHSTMLRYIDEVLQSINFNVVYSPDCKPTPNKPYYKLFEPYKGIIISSIFRKHINSAITRKFNSTEAEFMRALKARVRVRNEPVSASAAAAAATASARAPPHIAPLLYVPPVARELVRDIFIYLTADNPKLKGTTPSLNMIAFIELLITYKIHEDRRALDLLKGSSFADSDESQAVYNAINDIDNEVDRKKFITLFIQHANEVLAEREEEDKAEGAELAPTGPGIYAHGASLGSCDNDNNCGFYNSANKLFTVVSTDFIGDIGRFLHVLYLNP
jgi:hypothetical protein